MTNIAGQTKDASNESHRLRRGVLTVPNGIALAAAAMAPVLAVVLNAPAAGPVAGAALPLSFLLAFMFIGFDAAATLGEETRNPRRNVPLAVAGALGAVGVFYVFVMYALTAGYGLNDPSKLDAFLKDANPFVTLGQAVTPWLIQPIELAAIAGIFSCFLAIHNTTVRVMFSMGRDHVLPSSIGRVHARWFSPYRAIVVQSVFTIVVGLGAGAWLGPVATATGAYGFTGAIGTVAIVIVYLASNVALVRYFWSTAERRIGTHVIVPVLGVVALAYPLYSVIKPGQASPYNYVPWIVSVWILLGIGLYSYYRVKSPEKIAAIGTFVAEDDLPLDEQPGALLAARTPSVQHPTVSEEVARHPEVGDTPL
jgi:amino acid transporter